MSRMLCNCRLVRFLLVGTLLSGNLASLQLQIMWLKVISLASGVLYLQSCLHLAIQRFEHVHTAVVPQSNGETIGTNVSRITKSRPTVHDSLSAAC